MEKRMWQTGNLRDRITDDPTQLARQVAEGIASLGQLANHYLASLNETGADPPQSA